MRIIVLLAVVLVSVVSSASAQSFSRFEIGPVVRIDKVSIEGGAGGSVPVAGVAATFRWTPALGVEAEITHASRKIQRSYDGHFVSYIDTPNPTREEFERFAPTARRTLGYNPGTGWSVAFLARGHLSPRVTLGGRAGVSARRYRESSDFEVLTIPEGVDPQRVAEDFQDSSRTKVRGGWLLGVDVDVAVTERFHLAPEFRYVYSGPAQIGNKHREVALGIRAGWRF
jgi:hypothetical protein